MLSPSSSGSEDNTVSSPMVKQEPPSSDEDLFSGSSHNDEEQDICDLSKLTEGLTLPKTLKVTFKKAKCSHSKHLISFNFYMVLVSSASKDPK